MSWAVVSGNLRHRSAGFIFQRTCTKENFTCKTLVTFLPFLYSFNLVLLSVSSMFVCLFWGLRDMNCLSFFLIIFTQHFLNQDTGDIFSIF